MKCGQLDKAELVLAQEDLGVLIAWFGGHGFEVFDDEGNLVDHFSVMSAQDLTVHEARDIIVSHFEDIRAERDGDEGDE